MVVEVVFVENEYLEVIIIMFKQVFGLGFVYGVFVGDVDEFKVVQVFVIGNVGEVGIVFFVVFFDSEGVVLVVFFEEFFRIVVGVDVNFG